MQRIVGYKYTWTIAVPIYPVSNSIIFSITIATLSVKPLLPVERIEDYLKEDPVAFSVFVKNTHLLRFDGVRKTAKGNHMALGS